MVSYPTDDSRSLSQYSGSRRAPSVASSSGSTVRRHHHRYGRSHAGGTSSREISNEFPIFTHTGDVEIIVTPDPRSSRRRDSGRGAGGADHGSVKRYLLHRLILSQCSGFFEAGTSEECSRAREQGQSGPSTSTQVARYQTGPDGPPRKRWRYELDWGRGEDEVPMLVQKDPSSSIFGGDTDPRQARPPPTRPKPQPPPSGFFRSMANFSALNLSSHSRSTSNSNNQTDPLNPSDLLLQAYDSLFRIFYNYPPALDAVNIATAYVECKSLLQIADMYDALDVVGPRVDHHLLRFGSRLWKQIAKYPPSYLKLGYLARSRAIFAEAVIHVVGSWPACAQQLGYTGPYAPRGPSNALPAPTTGVTQLPEAVFELIEDKVDDLEDVKAKVEAKLWRLTLTTSRGERVNPANGWLDWLAMSLFRQWLAENTTPPPVSILKDSSNGRGSSRGSTSVNSSSHRQRSSSRSGRTQQPPPPSFNTAGSVLSASSASQPTLQVNQHVSRPPPPFNTGRVFRLLGTGGPAYLPHAELKAFLKLHPENYDRDKLRKFERRVEEVKNLARDVVKPLMRNFLQIDVVSAVPGEGGRERDGVAVGYLTCTRVGENEFPWEE